MNINEETAFFTILALGCYAAILYGEDVTAALIGLVMYLIGFQVGKRNASVGGA